MPLMREGGAVVLLTSVLACWDTRAGNYWKKDVFRLAVVCIEYPDVKHNPKISANDWSE